MGGGVAKNSGELLLSLVGLKAAKSADKARKAATAAMDKANRATSAAQKTKYTKEAQKHAAKAKKLTIASFASQGSANVSSMVPGFIPLGKKKIPITQQSTIPQSRLTLQSPMNLNLPSDSTSISNQQRYVNSQSNGTRKK